MTRHQLTPVDGTSGVRLEDSAGGGGSSAKPKFVSEQVEVVWTDFILS